MMTILTTDDFVQVDVHANTKRYLVMIIGGLSLK
jgi:hypothetical protein